MEDIENLTAGIKEMHIRQHKILVDKCKMRTTGGSRRHRKRSNRRARLRGQCRTKWMSVKRKRVYNNATPNPRGMKGGRRQNRKKGRGHYYAAVPFKTVTDVTGRPLRYRGNSVTPIGYSKRAALRRKKCDTRHDSRNSSVKEAPRRRVLLGNGLVNAFPEQRISTRQYWRWRQSFIFNLNLSDTCRTNRSRYHRQTWQ
jgi:hypothetical protein